MEQVLKSLIKIKILFIKKRSGQLLNLLLKSDQWAGQRNGHTWQIGVYIDSPLILYLLAATFCNRGQVLQLMVQHVDSASFLKRFALRMQLSQAWWLKNQFLAFYTETLLRSCGLTDSSHTAKQTVFSHCSKTTFTDLEFQKSSPLFFFLQSPTPHHFLILYQPRKTFLAFLGLTLFSYSVEIAENTPLGNVSEGDGSSRRRRKQPTATCFSECIRISSVEL